ncbi:hypothetical protein AB6A40_009400 [Gnathostoma spinigerum]|uniref:ATPase ASNA1 homolog n=1 Tax=Gnathostoma spinigerum TaxID=75299 RepID=A0ABD6EYZ9_9BILA
MDESDFLEPSLANVIEQNTLKWIFVGGKGGVGKTTCSCSLGVQLAAVRRSVLIISTDPAHNISDAFAQKFTKTPTLVNGFTNLYAMEVDSSFGSVEPPAVRSSNDNSLLKAGHQMLQEIAGGLPGIDEAMSFSQMIKLINSMDFDVVVFDTAPTGHTLRLLQFPTVIEKGLEKIMSFESSFSLIVSQVGGILGADNVSVSETTKKLKETQEVVSKINSQFRDPDLTTFVCVCIAEFLSLYETERLIQELAKQNIDTHNIIVNQLLFPDKDSSGCVKCKKCLARYNIQQKYLKQIDDLYDDFNVTKLPLLEQEVRGPEHIRRFSEYLVHPYGSETSI